MGHRGLNIGQYGAGTLNTTNAGMVRSVALVVMSGSAGSNGLVNINTGGQWNLINAAGDRQDLNIGYSGIGTINITSAGVLNAGMTTLGSFASGMGSVDVTGTGSVMNTGALRVGD